MFDFSGQTVLVTGATRGIGAALADAFEDAGADLVLTGTSPETIMEQNKRYEGRSRRYVAVDFTDHSSLNAFLEQLSVMPIDVCVNNAGINRIEQTETQMQEEYEAVMQVNLHAPVAIVKRLIPGMKTRGYGRIVNIASIWSEISKAGRGAYSASKAGIVGFTRALSIELAPKNILVNCVSPGFTLTELTEQSLSSEEQQKLAAQIPVGRLATPDDVAPPILFAASRVNSYMTGQNLVVDGGFVNV